MAWAPAGTSLSALPHKERVPVEKPAWHSHWWPAAGSRPCWLRWDVHSWHCCWNELRDQGGSAWKQLLMLLMLLINPELSVQPCSSILLPKYPTRLKSRFGLLCTTPVMERRSNPAGCSWPTELSWVVKGGHCDPRLSQLWHDRHGWGRGKCLGLRKINLVLWLFQFILSQAGIWPSWEYQKGAQSQLCHPFPRAPKSEFRIYLAVGCCAPASLGQTSFLDITFYMYVLNK